MNQMKSKHPPGTVGIATGELSRYTSFMQCLLALMVPEGSTWFWAQGGSVANNDNKIILGRKGEWVWFIGDDHTFDPRTVLHLLNRNVDIVVPLCPQRGAPFMPVVYTPNPDRPGRYFTRAWSDLPTTGMISEIGGVPIRTGQAGMLVRRKVLEKVPGPYWFEVGKIIPDQLSEDLYFAEKCLAAGFKIWLDLDAPLGHISNFTAMPARTEQGWRLDFDMGHQMRLRVNVTQDGLEPEEGDEDDDPNTATVEDRFGYDQAGAR
jgi:hypothetical protein